MLSNGFQGCPLSQPLTGTESQPLLGSRPTREPWGSSPSSATAMVLGGLGKPQPGRVSSWRSPSPGPGCSAVGEPPGALLPHPMEGHSVLITLLCFSDGGGWCP